MFGAFKAGLSQEMKQKETNDKIQSQDTVAHLTFSDLAALQVTSLEIENHHYFLQNRHQGLNLT